MRQRDRERRSWLARVSPKTQSARIGRRLTAKSLAAGLRMLTHRATGIPRVTCGSTIRIAGDKVTRDPEFIRGLAVGADTSPIRRLSNGELLVSAQPFGHANATLREAEAIAQRRSSRGARMRARQLEAANQGRDLELTVISQELRSSLRALRTAEAALATGAVSSAIASNR